MDSVDMKKCRGICGKEYPNTLKFFSKKGDKLRYICKKCDSIMRKERLKKEKENTTKSRIVLSEKEEKVFRKKAEEFNMSRTDFMKLIVLKGEKEILVKINPQCFDNFNYQIMGIATNINQIAHICNTTRSVNEIDVENLRNEFKKIREWQKKIEEEFKMLDTSIKYTNEVLTFDDI